MMMFPIDPGIAVPDVRRRRVVLLSTPRSMRPPTRPDKPESERTFELYEWQGTDDDVGDRRCPRCSAHAARRQLLREASSWCRSRDQVPGPSRLVPGQVLRQEDVRSAYVISFVCTFLGSTLTVELSYHPRPRLPGWHRLRSELLLPPP